MLPYVLFSKNFYDLMLSQPRSTSQIFSKITYRLLAASQRICDNEKLILTSVALLLSPLSIIFNAGPMVPWRQDGCCWKPTQEFQMEIRGKLQMNRLSKDKFERIEVGGWDVSRMWLSKCHSVIILCCNLTDSSIFLKIPGWGWREIIRYTYKSGAHSL